MTFIDDLEEDATVVATNMRELLEQTVATLAPDGRPFLMTELSDEEQIAGYMQIRGNTQAWETWINERAQDIINRLSAAGVPPAELAAIQPFRIAEAFAMDFSKRMEEKLKNYGNTSRA